MKSSQVFNISNLDYLREIPDKFFDLVVDDPPYGLGFSDYERVGQGIECQKRYTKNEKKQWDSYVPSKDYFDQLFRVSKNQIIWGGNYFDLPPTQCFIFWYKQNPVPNFADGELAWTSFKKPAVCFPYRYYGNLEGVSSVKQDKIHPTQKPIAVYDYCYQQFLPNGGKVFDGHGGSGSNRISAYKAGNIDFYACEIDKGYFEESEKRFNNFVSVHSPASENPITFDGQHKLF